MTVSRVGLRRFSSYCCVGICSLLIALTTADLRADDAEEKDGKESSQTLDWQIQSSHTALQPGTSEFFLRTRTRRLNSGNRARSHHRLETVPTRMGPVPGVVRKGFCRASGPGTKRQRVSRLPPSRLTRASCLYFSGLAPLVVNNFHVVFNASHGIEFPDKRLGHLLEEKRGHSTVDNHHVSPTGALQKTQR